MGKIKMGNSKKKSSFVCIKCLRKGIDGIQRKGQREKFHKKELYCIFCKSETKHIEVRYCDWMEEVMKEAQKLHNEIYLMEAIL